MNMVVTGEYLVKTKVSSNLVWPFPDLMKFVPLINQNRFIAHYVLTAVASPSTKVSLPDSRALSGACARI